MAAYFFTGYTSTRDRYNDTNLCICSVLKLLLLNTLDNVDNVAGISNATLFVLVDALASVV